MTNEEIIEEILHDASTFGIMHSVISRASAIMESEPKIERVVAFEKAYNELKPIKIWETKQ
jgi:hypothetical protein